MTARDLDRELAGLLCIGFHGTSPSAEVLELIRRGVGSVVLFSRNLVEAEQVAGLVGELKRAAPGPLLVAIDQEGGRVARLRAAHGFTELPPMRRLGQRGDEALAFEAGALLGRELRAVGIDLDFAPVVDVDTNPLNPVIGDRSLSRDAAAVARLGAALARGLQSAGVAACAKHFPGHGDTSQDSHLTLPRLPHPLSRLQAVELPPFTALARAGVAAVMTAHVVFEPLDPERPATLAPAVLRLLREVCGFDGACVSDDLEMKAITGAFPLEVAAPGALVAGVDQLLLCHTAAAQHRAIDLLREAAETGRLTPVRRAEAAARVAALRRWAGPPPDPRAVRGALRTGPHLALAEALGREAAGRDPTGG
jgi:beta-N-acetylhexosaminidase